MLLMFLNYCTKMFSRDYLLRFSVHAGFSLNKQYFIFSEC